MALEIIGKLQSKLSVQSVTSARGNWSKQEFIIETQEQYPKKICMNVWGEDKVEELKRYNIGDMLKISVNIESREFKERWYTDIRAWRIEPMDSQQPSNSGFQDRDMSTDTNSAYNLTEEGDEDDLPF